MTDDCSQDDGTEWPWESVLEQKHASQFVNVCFIATGDSAWFLSAQASACT